MSDLSPLPDPSDEALPVEADALRDPYDGVALGVECAWPSDSRS
jgi:hypothetical protein